MKTEPVEHNFFPCQYTRREPTRALLTCEHSPFAYSPESPPEFTAFICHSQHLFVKIPGRQPWGRDVPGVALQGLLDAEQCGHFLACLAWAELWASGLMLRICANIGE